jgi:hypothetical protein
MKKKQKWIRLEEKGDRGLHIPTGEVVEHDGGWFSSTQTMEYFHKVVGFFNEETGEIKLFKKSVVERIGIDNLKL